MISQTQFAQLGIGSLLILFSIMISSWANPTKETGGSDVRIEEFESPVESSVYVQASKNSAPNAGTDEASSEIEQEN